MRTAIREDVQGGDVTTHALVAASHRSEAVIFSKEPAVLCGIEIACKVFRVLNRNVKCQMLAKDGQEIKPMKPVLALSGSSRALLTAERTALNFLSYLSAIATKTFRFVQQVKPYSCTILDTRKTTPTLRFLERYAVRTGGGSNHRHDLAEMAMIKDNHWLIAGREKIAEAMRLIRQKRVPVELEVDNLKQLEEALQWNVDIILLDNMTPETVKKAVGLRNKWSKKTLLEVSGGINTENIRSYAKTGVDRISIGGLTHSRNAIDFSMEILPK
ncbi:MAG: carboxylating nicotinate-nucleotide diphosphorylase [Candidatus Omnitrophica bacterium]|nr:carboxylating nicotinate-nucleotide diphosphorylase [Candidatus Omnitrophota bacterium]